MTTTTTTPRRATTLPQLMRYSERIYRQGHLPNDFHGKLAPHLITVLPVLPPARMGGIHTPDQATEIAGAFALSHIVCALPYEPFMIWHGTEVERQLCIGDVIKCREAHLDPLDGKKHSGMCSLPAEHIVSIIFAAEGEVVPEMLADDEPSSEPTW